MSTFFDFLDRHHAIRGTIHERDACLSSLMDGLHPDTQRSAFAAMDDTYLFTQLISKFVDDYCPSQTSTLIDLGAGSCIPTLKALKSNLQQPLRVTAVELDSDSAAIARANVEMNGLRERCEFIEQDMLSFLNLHRFSSTEILVANPPYLPTPAHCNDGWFHPVDGGLDGTKYLQPILEYAYPKGMRIALEWCSLSSPSKIIQLVEQHYRVLYLQAYRAPFGTYVNKVPLFSHLHEQRNRGESIFLTENGVNYFWFVGMILERIK
ncbi:MAG: methyltransferase [Deltaproteobacteria bacterium]|nr:methyltransferase [Deltaproteobacteria bacterium]